MAWDAGELTESIEVPHGTSDDRTELTRVNDEIKKIGNPLAESEQEAKVIARLLDDQRLLRIEAQGIQGEIDAAISRKQHADEHGNKIVIPRLNELNKRKRVLEAKLGLNK